MSTSTRETLFKQRLDIDRKINRLDEIDEFIETVPHDGVIMIHSLQGNNISYIFRPSTGKPDHTWLKYDLQRGCGGGVIVTTEQVKKTILESERAEARSYSTNRNGVL